MQKERLKKIPKPSVNGVSITGQKAMNIYTRKGEKVLYANVDSGTESDRDTANSLLELGKIYTVKKVSIYRNCSRVYFFEVDYAPGFNTALFQNLEN